MKQITLYNPAELKEVNPEGFETALEWYRNSNNDLPWGNEIIDSLKAIFDASGINLHSWNIDAYGYSYVQFNMDSDVQEFTGNRALAWIENNLLSDLRIPFTGSRRYELAKYGQYYRPGMIKPCPFTGVCFDEDFLESLHKSIRDGETLQDAYKNLAVVASNLFQAEYEQMNSEESFLLQDHMTFTEYGKYVY